MSDFCISKTTHSNCIQGRWDISSAGHVEKGKTPLEAAYDEVAEELGIDLKSMRENDSCIFDGGLQYAFTIPAKQAPLGGCNAYEHVFFLVLNKNSELKLSLGTEEVTDVSWMESEKLMRSLRSDDDQFAPRTHDYVDAMEKHIKLIVEKRGIY
jgi:8-oxo-dGTP pyrophosphatase MutT (NUDIX family)